MLYTSEDTTGALLRDLSDGRLDLAVTFCASELSRDKVELRPLEEEPAVVHLPADHPLADHAQLTVADLAGETVLVRRQSRLGGVQRPRPLRLSTRGRHATDPP